MMARSGINHTVAFGHTPKNRDAAEMSILAQVFKIDADHLEERQSAPQLFLYAHAIELILKSYLVAKGEAKDSLATRFRHNLTAAMEFAESKGLHVLNYEDKTIIKELDKANNRANLRYELQFDVEFLPEDLRRIAGTLIAATQRDVMM